MKIVLLTLNSAKESWVQNAIDFYLQRISKFISIEKNEAKPFKSAREDKIEKKKKDSDIILSKIEPSDYVILCDEQGKALTSIDFSKKLTNIMNQSKKKCIFVIGGPFGASDELKKRSDFTLNLSPFTMNHWLAEIVILEQIYRGLMIIKNIPYHNEG